VEPERDLVIRHPTDEDFEEWFALYDAVAREGRWIGAEGPVDREGRRDRFEQVLANPDVQMFVAELGGLLVGELNVRLEGGRADFGMMVRHGHRGRGIGSALMETCIAWARDNGAHKVTLTVWPHNTRAIALYRRYGFSSEGRLVRHYRRRSGELWDAIPMGLVLDDHSPGCSVEAD
jgi:ribosomal protein S18 acetylase RimI-like enzyme